MSHLVLALPIVALSLFWLLPLPPAITAYGAIGAASGLMCWSAMRAMKRPPQNGVAALVGEIGKVVGTTTNDLLVQVHNELWHARSRRGVQEGDRVKVVDYSDTALTVDKVDAK